MKREPTTFEMRVYDTAKRIPRGRVSTYAEIARAISCGSKQAIGQALKRNPFAPEVPCHRVISSTLEVGGFFGEREGSQITKKRRMLEAEGITFDDDGRVSAEYLFHFESEKGMV